MDYATIKAVHIACAILSIAGFALRGVLRMRDSPLLAAPFARVAPHTVDTLLLASALSLCWMSGQYPFAQDWLTAKLLALVVYIVLGTIALKHGRTRGERAFAFVLALATASYIVAVALARDAAGFTGLPG